MVLYGIILLFLSWYKLRFWNILIYEINNGSLQLFIFSLLSNKLLSTFIYKDPLFPAIVNIHRAPLFILILVLVPDESYCSAMYSFYISIGGAIAPLLFLLEKKVLLNMLHRWSILSCSSWNNLSKVVSVTNISHSLSNLI